MKKIVAISLVATTAVMASGYRIPESSLNATALSSANVAHAHGADAAYYNPANMIWGTDGAALEVDLTYIGLSKIDFQGTDAPDPTQYDIDSKSESFLVPTLHYVSPKLKNARVGFSIVSPAGLSKRWDDQPAKSGAQEFTLKTVEVNPSVAFRVNEKTAVAFGLRFIHSEGIVKAAYPADVVTQDMNGDGFDVGYNMALSYRPTEALSLAATYRSRVNLNIDGDADLFYIGAPAVNGNYGVNVTVPVPAVASLAAAYTFDTGTTVEVVLEHTYWSAYKSLDFDYDNATAEAVFGSVKSKEWRDTNALRLGITQQYDKWTAMAGALIDTSPVPEETLGFELPGSDSYSVSLGGRYAVSDRLNIGIAGLMNIHDDRRVDGALNSGGIDGEFTDTKAYLVTVGAELRF